MLTVLACLGVAACGFDVRYGTGYRCIDDADCPDGQRCDDNSCQLPEPGGGDGGPHDAPGPDAALVNLLVDPGFEVANDEDWGKYNSTLTQTIDDPHGGTSSGHVCELSSDEAYTIFQVVEQAPQAGVTYVGSVWARTPGEAVTARLTIREATDGDWIDHHGDDVLLGGDWVELSVAATIEEANRDVVQLIVWGLAAAGPCFDVDDAAAYRPGS
jgi:hypothetical protein